MGGTPVTPQGVFSLLSQPVAKEKIHNSTRRGTAVPPNQASAGARRKVRARSAVPPSVVRCDRTADSRQQTADSTRMCRRQQQRRALASLDFATHANQSKCECKVTRSRSIRRGGGQRLRAAAPLRRCAAAPLRRCAAAPRAAAQLRLCRLSLASRARLARSPFRLPRLSRASRREIYLLSNNALCRWLECHSSTDCLHGARIRT